MPKVYKYKQLEQHFWDLYKQYGDYGRAWAELHDWYVTSGPGSQKTDPDQSWRSSSGRAFEHIAVRLIHAEVSSGRLASLIRIVRWDQLDCQIQRGILAEPVWPKGNITQSEIAESKVDVIALAVENGRPYRIVSVYSCKSSVAERYQQDLFWAEKIKGRGIKFCFVTIDEDFVRHATTVIAAGAAKGKTLPLAQAVYDRIYLLTNETIITDSQVFRRVETVVEDLDLWLKAY